MIRKRLGMNLGLFAAAVLLTNCLTVNITVNFPEAEVENAADRMNRDIRGDIFSGENEATAPAEAPAAPEGSSWLRLPDPFALARLRVSFGMPAAHAQDEKIDLKTTNPIIRKIKEQRAARAKQINQFLSNGSVGEGNDGYLKEGPKIDALDLMQLAKVRQILKAENDDRKALYNEFAKINDLPVEKVAKTFADSNQKWLLAGQYYQNQDKKWVEKTKEQEEKDRKELKAKGLLD